MRVRSTVPHYDQAGELRLEGDEYTLEGTELELRLKDQIVVPVDPTAAPDPAK